MPPIGEPKLVTVNPTRYAPILLLEMGIHGMEWNWASIIGLVTTILTFATALLAYLRERIKRPSESVSTAHLRIRHLSRAAGSPWITAAMKVFLPVGLILSVVYLAASVFTFRREPSLRVAVVVAFWTSCLAFYVHLFRSFRRDPDAPSRLRREARVTIDGAYDAVFDRCESAIRMLGAKIISLDRDRGQIHARTGLSWGSFGERVDIVIMRHGDTACSIVLTSYNVIPGTLVDYGKNSRNLDVLLDNL